MKKNQKRIAIFLIVVFAILAVFILINTPFTPFSIGSTTPSGQYVKTINSTASTFTCIYDSCVVYGQMDIQKNSGGNTVQWYCTYASNQNSCSSRGGLKYYLSQSDCEASNKPCSGSTSYSSSGCGSSGSCSSVGTAPIWSAYFNFNPSTDDFFPFGSNGTSNLKTISNPGTATTDSVTLSSGQSIKSFLPKYPDNSLVNSHIIFADLYDNSCKRQVNLYDGTACDASENYVLCRPKTLNSSFVCPTGYNPQASATCLLQGTNSASYHTNVCFKSFNDCINPITTIDSTYYSSCSSTQKLSPNNVDCGAYVTNSIQDAQGKKCFTKASGGTTLATSVSVGILKCDVSSCNPGQRSGSIGSTNFQECSGSGCSYSLTPKTCPQIPYSLVFDGNNKCVFNPDNHCNKQGDTECDASGYVRTCQLLTTTGIDGEQVTDYQWSSFGRCNGGVGDQVCTNGACGCDTANKCTKYSKSCSVDGTSYSTCDYNGLYTCLDYRGITSVDDNHICQSGNINPKPGCKYTPSVCINGQKCNNVTNTCVTPSCSDTTNPFYFTCDTNNFESCSGITCVCQQDSNTALASDFSSNLIRCSSNTVQKVIKHNNCYRWENKTDASNSNNGACLSDFTCSAGICQSNNQFVAISALDNYPVGYAFNNLTVILQDKIPSKSQATITAQLFDTNNNEPTLDTNYHSINGIGVSGDGTLNLNFGSYVPTSVGQYTVKVIVRDVNGQIYTYSKKLNVAKTLRIYLSCPAGIVGRSLSCTLNTQDASCPSTSSCPTIPSNKIISISQGTNQITNYQQPPNPTGGIYLVFTPLFAGTAEVSVSATAQDYISASKTVRPIIGQLTLSHVVLVDSKDYSLFSSATIGNHAIAVTPLESGIALPTSSVSVTVTNPSTGTDNYVLDDPTNSGTFRGTFSLSGAGQGYTIQVQVVPQDALKRADNNNIIPFSTTTLKSGTSDWWSNYAIMIAVGAGLLIVFFIVIIVVIRNKRPSATTI